MEKLDKLTGIAAPMEIKNVDTDMIIPKQFLKTIKRTGLGVNLFDEMRYNDDGSENEDFVLNQEPYRNAKILIAEENFGCGSSREHAPWALLDFGIKVIIAPSFADIFYNNSFKNGVLPLVLSEDEVMQLMDDAKSDTANILSIDLERQEVIRGNKASFKFEIDPFRKKCLLEGLDDIALTLEHDDEISEFEDKRASWM